VHQIVEAFGEKTQNEMVAKDQTIYHAGQEYDATASLVPL
jgi:hypothetical protein